MSLNRQGRVGFLPRRSLLGIALAVAAVSTIAGCGGSSGGGGSSLDLVGVVAEGLGLLPQTSLYLNNRLLMEFTNDIDPASVTPQTLKVLIGPDYNASAEGVVGVTGKRIIFIPKLPTEPDLSDSGFVADTAYRLVIRGLPDLNIIRSKNGKPLAKTYTFDFKTRDFEPYFSDFVPGPPSVLGLMIDLNGDGVLDGDGDPDTSDPEEFFGDETQLIPFVTGVPTGSSNAAPPHAPLQAAVIFSEPLQPGGVFQDSEDLNGDGFPDGDGSLDSFFTLDLTNEYDCDDPDPVDGCPKPLLFDFTFTQDFVAARDSFLVLATMRYDYALRAFSQHRILVKAGLADFVGNEVAQDFAAVFDTGARFSGADRFFEDYSDRNMRAPESTALWNTLDSGYLKAGAGIGGDGGDGPGIEADTASLVLDTTGNSGIYNFSSFVFPDNVAQFDITIKGDKPAVIRVLGNVEIPAKVTIDAGGQMGVDGGVFSAAPRPGGLGGPGGGGGGAGSPDGAGSAFGEAGVSPPGTDAGGLGGTSGVKPGGGGGGGHSAAGENGAAGASGGSPGGAGGAPFGTGALDPFYGGGGGGGGGSHQLGGVESAGAGGGGGGGAIMFDCFGTFRLTNQSSILVNGGRGGLGGRDSSGEADSAGGGGGAGGSIVIRCLDVISLGGKVEAKGGTGGTVQLPAGRGGNGSKGYIRVEDLDVKPACSLCDPSNFEYAPIDPELLGFTIGRSKFFATNLPPGSIVRYAFDANDVDGSINPDGSDIVLLGPDGVPTGTLPSNATVHIFFRGAFEDPARPNEPDASTISPWVANVAQLDGYTMIQYEVRFDIGDDIANDPPAPAVDDFRIRITVE